MIDSYFDRARVDDRWIDSLRSSKYLLFLFLRTWHLPHPRGTIILMLIRLYLHIQEVNFLCFRWYLSVEQYFWVIDSSDSKKFIPDWIKSLKNKVPIIKGISSISLSWVSNTCMLCDAYHIFYAVDLMINDNLTIVFNEVHICYFLFPSWFEAGPVLPFWVLLKTWFQTLGQHPLQTDTLLYWLHISSRSHSFLTL